METLALGLRVLLSLGAVLVLVWWFQRRLTRGSRGSGAEAVVQVITRQVISPKASVVVVETGGQRLLLGVTETSVNVLQTSAAEAVPAASFESCLENAGAESSADDSTPSGAHSGPRRRAAGPAHARKGQGPIPAGSPLAGSVLSPATWRQAATFVRGGRNG